MSEYDLAGSDLMAIRDKLKAGGTPLSFWVPTHDPFALTSQGIYDSVKKNLNSWINGAYRRS